MNLRTQRKLAAKVLNCGVNRVWIDPERTDEISMAITREEIRKLVHEKAIVALRENSQSRARARLLSAKKKKGRRIGPGSKKGKNSLLFPEKNGGCTDSEHSDGN